MNRIMPLNAHAVSQIPLPKGKINLNAGTLSPTPAPIFERAEALRRQTAANPSDFCWRQMPTLVQTSRAALANYLQCSADELLLLPNVTYAINIVVSSLNLPRGAEILMTDHEYGSMIHLWNRWSAIHGWKLRTLSIPASRATTTAEILALFRDALTPSTQAVFLSHSASPTGLVFPIIEICSLARQRNILSIVDGAHAPGMLPLNLAEIGADFYGANTHKWLMGPNGGGFLHVSRAHRLALKPLVTAWGWDHKPDASFEDSGNGGSRWQWNLEFHGTADRVPQMLMPEQLAFRQALAGEAEIHAHMRALSDYARKVIPLRCSFSG